MSELNFAITKNEKDNGSVVAPMLTFLWQNQVKSTIFILASVALALAQIYQSSH
jgi:hypothetical protein